ncbi:hypothetical protein CsSME_00010632 [Camellia sinensis var. sinensis]
MDVEKRASKGGFLQLFDWNVKSRKKLFSNKSELPEDSQQGKENVANSIILHPQHMEAHENGPGLRGKKNGDYNFASSVTSDEGYETRVPGVVARLMGLDSMPTTISDPCSSTPFFDSPSVKDSCSQRSTYNFQIEHHIINMSNDGIARNVVESRLQKVQSRPIERFQTEALPPKSAKYIPITHHRLLSPIKSPGFIPTNNAAYIMEAAAKMIKHGPPSTIKSKTACFGSSSVPLRIRDLKEKLEAERRASGPLESSQRPKELISFRYNKGKHSEKNHRRSGDKQLYNASMGSVRDSSDYLNKKGKSVSLAVQAKVNVLRREGLPPSGNRSSINRKLDDKVKPVQFNKSQSNVQKSGQKGTSTSRTMDVLKHNNQKQNCVGGIDRLAAKASISNQQDRKIPSTNGSVRPNKTSNKVLNSGTVCRKMNSAAKDTRKELLSSKTKTSDEKKQPIYKDIHFEESVAKNISITRHERSVKCNIANDGCLNWDVLDRKHNMDVVSFTFTSPIRRLAPGSQSSGEVMEKRALFCVDPCDDNDPHDLKNPTLSSPGLNEVGGNVLNVLLEQKLKELTCRVESSTYDLVESGSASGSFSLQDSLSTLNVMNSFSTEHHNSFQLNQHKDNSSPLYDIDLASVDDLRLKAKQKWQGFGEMEGNSSSSNSSECVKELDCRSPSPISNLEPSSSYGSCYSSDSKTSFISNGFNQCLWDEARGMVDCVSARKCQLVEVETELSDSASSTSATYMGGKDTSTTCSLIDFEKSSKWQLEYITKILCNSELILDDLVLGQVNKVITPNLFDQLENPKTGGDENAKERKVLFDCVSECLELRSEHLFGASCKTWSKRSMLFGRMGWLAEEFYKEISSWTSMGDLMVDELVNKDMSSWHGRWVDFEIEEFEEGVEIEKGILTSLVDELVVDFLLV